MVVGRFGALGGPRSRSGLRVAAYSGKLPSNRGSFANKNFRDIGKTINDLDDVLGSRAGEPRQTSHGERMARALIEVFEANGFAGLGERGIEALKVKDPLGNPCLKLKFPGHREFYLIQKDLKRLCDIFENTSVEFCVAYDSSRIEWTSVKAFRCEENIDLITVQLKREGYSEGFTILGPRDKRLSRFHPMDDATLEYLHSYLESHESITLQFELKNMLPVNGDPAQVSLLHAIGFQGDRKRERQTF